MAILFKLLRILKWLLLVVLVLAIVLVAGVYAVRTWLLPDLTRLEPQIEAQLSKIIKQPVQVKGLGIHWNWASADIALDSIIIGPQDAPVIQAKGIKTTVLAHPLAWGEVQTSGDGLNVDSLTITARQTGTVAAPQWFVAGLDMAAPSDGKGLRWVLTQPGVQIATLNVAVQDAAKHWLPEGRSTVALRNVILNNTGVGRREHSFSAAFAPQFNDPRLGAGVAVQAKFTHGVLDDAAQFKRWSGQATINIPNAHIARSAVWALPLVRSLAKDQAQQWQRWAKQSAADARLMASTKVEFGPARVSASGKLTVLDRSDDINTLRQAVSPLQWSLVSTAASAAQRLQISADTVLLAPLASLLHSAPLSHLVQSTLAQAQVQGTLTKVTADMQISKLGLQSLIASADVAQLGMQSTDVMGDKGLVNIPSVGGLTGSLKVKHTPQQTDTHISLNSQAAFADLPRLLAEPRVQFDALAGEIDVVMTSKDVTLNVDKVRFSNVDAAGEMTGQYSIASTLQNSADQSLGLAQFSGAFSRANLAQLHRYMPLSLSDNARAWLRHTLASGQAEQLQFTLNGELSRFPFLPDVARAGEQFDLQAKVTGAVLNFNPLAAQVNAPVSRSVSGSALGSVSAISSSTTVPTSRGIAAIKPWPLIEKVSGALRLNGLSLTLLEMSGDAAGIAVRMPKLTIASLTAPVVVFQTRASANAQQVLDLVRTTPLSEQLGEQFDALKLSGTVAVDANLTLDIAQPQKNLTQAIITTDQINLQLNSEIPPIERINARIAVTQSKATVEQATALWLGGLVQVDGVLDTQDPAQSLRVAGRAQLVDIKQHFKNAMIQALLSHANGGVDYGLDIAFKPEGLRWQVSADFKQAALQWPGLLDKPVGVSLPFTLTRSPTQRTVFSPNSNEQRISSDTWEASLGATVLGPFKALVQRRLIGSEWRVERSAVALGESAEINLPDQGLGIHIVTPKANLDLLRAEIEALPWKALPNLAGSPDVVSKTTSNSRLSNGVHDGAQKLSQGSTSVSFKADTTPAWMPSVLALQVDDLFLANRRFYNVAGAAVRELTGDQQGQQGQYWRGNIVAKGINGYFSWRDGSAIVNGGDLGRSQLVAQLTELNIPSSEVVRTSQSLLQLSPAQVPSVDISIDQLTVSDKPLGRIALKASNATKDKLQSSWIIDALSISSPQATINATGQWIQAQNVADGAGEVSLSINLQTDSLGAALEHFGHDKVLAGAAGKATAQLRWRGTPFALDLPSLSGTVNADFDKGNFLKVDPGAGKLIGLFSLQNLPRRLTLDFKDTFEKGFAFNDIKATATIDKGILITDDFLMRGRIADVRALGSVSLVDETQALTFTVKPDFNAGSVSLLYMIINPPIGLATLAAQYIFKEPISRALTLQYSITGPWSKPDIKQVKRGFQ